MKRTLFLPRPLDRWLLNGRRGLRSTLALFEELKGGNPTVLTFFHYHGTVEATIDKLIEGDVRSWGSKLFKILTRRSEYESAESIRTCTRLRASIGEVLILADDLLDLAKRVDPRGITDALALAKNLRRQVITLNDIVDDLLKLRNQGFEYLEDAEEDGMLNYQLLEDF